ncbi:MAG: ABC transporter ATP-binding protein [Verrucomicrobiota bacterium]
MTAALAFSKLSKSYPKAKTPALHEISFTLQQGEILALIGESGSGKSTLLRTAAGLEKPDSGELSLGSQTLVSQSVFVPPEKRSIGLVFQDGALFPHLNAFDNLIYGLQGKTTKEKRDAARQLLELVGLADKSKRFPHELSGGERQRLAVGRTLAPRPKVILLDEPFGSLDPALRRKLRQEVIDLLHRFQTSVILVTHDPEDALSVADRIIALRSGCIEQTGTPADFYNRPANAYCAELFGPANELRLESGDARWFRPERVKLADESDNAAISVEIARVRNKGRHLELQVRPANSKLSPTSRLWTIELPTKTLLDDRKTIRIHVD